MLHRRNIALVWITLLLASACDGGTELLPEPPQPATVTVTPATAALTALDDTVQLTAQVRDQYGETMAGISVAWSSSDAQVASADAAGLVTAVGNGTATITAKAGTVSGTAKVTVEQVLSAISISAAADSMVHGDTLRFAAEGADANGNVMEGIEFSWASSDTSVAMVDTAGLATGTGPGNAEITATSSGVTGGTELLVVPRVPTTVVVTPDSVTFAALADTMRIAVEVRDQIGRVMSGFAVAWTSGDTTVASVDSGGLATAIGNGTAAITAAADTASGTAEVTVEQVLAAISVSAATNSMVHGDTLRFTAEGADANGHAMEGIDFTWASSDTSVATVDTAGLATGTGPGKAGITATSSGVTAGAELRVVPRVPAAVAVTPDSVTFAALADTMRMTAEVRDQIGRVMSGFAVAWTSGDTTVASVDSAGLATSVGNGTAAITATADTVAGRAEVTVGQLVSAISVSPTVDSVFQRDTLRFAAEETDANGHRVPATEFHWTSSDTSVALVDANGLATGVGPGDAEITATASGVTGKAELRVLARVPTTVSVVPDSVTLFAVADTVRMTAEVRDQTGRVISGSSATWTSADTLVAVVDSAGLVTAVANGTSTVTAKADTATGTVEIAVDQLLEEISISPPTDTLFQLDTLRLTADALDANGYSIPAIAFQWSSADDSVAVVDTGGLVTGMAEGIVTIVAAADGAEGRSEIVVMVHPDRAALVELYNATNGPTWWVADNWTSTAPLREWSGVTVGKDGRVTVLALRGNGLDGPLPSELANLTSLTKLNLAYNRLTGSIPRAFGKLSKLTVMDFDSNHLTGPIPSEIGQLTEMWRLSLQVNKLTGPIPPELGNLSKLGHLYLYRNSLTGPIPPEIGKIDNLQVALLYANRLTGPLPSEMGNLSRLWLLSIGHNSLDGAIPPEIGKLEALWELHLNDNNLTGAIPVSLSNPTKLRRLYLQRNALTGSIPSELGRLAYLEQLHLQENHLTGNIPPELGNLASLQEFHLFSNTLTGPIPAELAELDTLRSLLLHDNKLTGSIPSTLGSLSHIDTMSLHNNHLTGVVPAELGKLTKLVHLRLDHNDLQGPIPKELGSSEMLVDLHLDGNPKLSGPLPSDFTELQRLQELFAHGTDLCAPSDTAFQTWLKGVERRRVAGCNADQGRVYLTQPVQHRLYPVPMVAGRDALLRVFVVAKKKTSESIPKVVARFYRDDKETYKVTIPGKSTPIPTEVEEGSLLKSANATIPDTVVKPDLEVVLEIDPDGTLDDSLGVPKRIPETGRLPVDVRKMALFDLTIVPFLYSSDPDSSIIKLAKEMVDDPKGHKLFRQMHDLLPIEDLDVVAHAPVETNTNNSFALLSIAEALHVLENAQGYYMGTMAGPVAGPAGIAGDRNNVLFARPWSYVIAHELGHSFWLDHAPCGNPAGVDPKYPNKDGSIEGWGYDQGGDTLVHPDTKDLMSYCSPQWIGDYHFTKMVRRREARKHARGGGTAPSPRESLLLWGGVADRGVPFLAPAIVLNAPTAVPDDGGDYRLTGSTEDDGELFSFRFAMQDIADGDGRKSFAFAIPVQPEWADSLATITLSGPEGEAKLDAEGDRSVVIWRDPRTGQVRGILRDLLPEAAFRTRAALLARDSGLEVFISRGIPDAAAWKR